MPITHVDPSDLTPPRAPGALGSTLDTAAVLKYLDALRRWQQTLHAKLQLVDLYAQSSPDQAALMPDLTLAMTVVESIDARIVQLIDRWDSGRVLAKQTIEISELIWGRLDGNLRATLAVSFVEACSLGATLVRSLRERLDANGAALRGRQAQLIDEAIRIGRTADRCHEKIADAPMLAIPDPAELGDVPELPVEQQQFAAKLERCAEALRVAERAYEEPLRERDELRAVMGAYLDMAAHSGAIEHADVGIAERAARSALWTAPCDLVLARTLVTQLQVVARAAVDTQRQVPTT